MRIIAGELRSRIIQAPKGMETRPTLDRTRESLFNIIAARCFQSKVLDLYAGSGALAFEAVSRGAAGAVLCDASREAARVIRQNIASLGLEGCCRLLFMRDARAVGLLGEERERFDLVFLDPPYRMDIAPACSMMLKAGILEDGALIVAEHASVSEPHLPDCFALTDCRKYRETVISFYVYGGKDCEQSTGVSGQL